MTPSASCSATTINGATMKNNGQHDNDKNEDVIVGNSKSFSNGSMPSLLTEGVVSPVDEEETTINDNQALHLHQQQLGNSQTASGSGMGIPSMNSSSEDWEIEGRGNCEDAKQQTTQWLLTSPEKLQNENTNEDDSISNDNTTTSSFRSSPKSGRVYACATPPTRPYTPTRSETPLSYYNRSGTDNKSWLDPFPTPDISLSGRQNWQSFDSNNNTSSNHQGRIIDAGIGRSNNTNNTAGLASQDWNDMIKQLPKLRLFDEKVPRITTC